MINSHHILQLQHYSQDLKLQIRQWYQWRPCTLPDSWESSPSIRTIALSSCKIYLIPQNFKLPLINQRLNKMVHPDMKSLQLLATKTSRIWSQKRAVLSLKGAIQLHSCQKLLSPLQMVKLKIGNMQAKHTEYCASTDIPSFNPGFDAPIIKSICPQLSNTNQFCPFRVQPFAQHIQQAFPKPYKTSRTWNPGVGEIHVHDNIPKHKKVQCHNELKLLAILEILTHFL